MPRQRSFLQRLSSTLHMNGHNDREYEEGMPEDDQDVESKDAPTADDHDGQLGVDVYETSNAIIIKAMVAGVKKNDLEISISRESVTLRGERYDTNAPDDATYIYQELYWGSFARTVELPDEVDIDHAEATEKNGLLVITLPKGDKKRTTKLEIE